jgi:hypothetical protein
MEHRRLLDDIVGFCKQAGIAESTLGRLAVNDGKLVQRARDGATIGKSTITRVYEFMEDVNTGKRVVKGRAKRKRSVARAEVLAEIRESETSVRPYRVYEYNDERQKHHLLANTCNEKWVIADRCYNAMSDMEFKPPAFRIFDGSLGNGIVTARVLRALHAQHPNIPFQIVAKERGLDDLRNALGRFSDRFLEHPLTVLVVTNMYFDEATSLTTNSVQAAMSLNWQEVPLKGTTAYDFQQQISALHPQLANDWRITTGEDGQSLYEKPSVLVLYREDHKFLLDDVIPRPGYERREYDFILASHLYSHTASEDFKINKVLKPLAESLAPGGRMLVIQSYGQDPAHDVVKRIWEDEAPVFVRRQELINALRSSLGENKRNFTFTGATDKTSLFRFDMHTLPIDPDNDIGTPTLLAAWNNLVYVCQVPEKSVDAVMKKDGNFLKVTTDVINEYGGLWFINESFVMKRSNN